MLPFISTLAPLRAANRFGERALYDWLLYSETGSEAVANNTSVFRTLRHYASRGALIGSLESDICMLA